MRSGFHISVYSRSLAVQKIVHKEVGMQNNELEKGFTLIEMLVVLVIITLLATLVGPKLFSKIGSSQVKVAGAQIELISSGLDTYRLDVGRFPTAEQGLEALRKTPSGVKHWDGPYLSKAIPLDPWGNAYHYKLPGKDGPYALYTLGKDAVVGGEKEDKDQGQF
ncbi:type II secretion system major pseudopilin GspG [Mariprofundus ferrooxydans]|nr:type II secretion system major pseudopilin GspG [Mariprofundus ferrooxydans]MBN4077137.1 type II secretion system major pseudopilin GspG [Mariprofundus ferrooxydans]